MCDAHKNKEFLFHFSPCNQVLLQMENTAHIQITDNKDIENEIIQEL